MSGAIEGRVVERMRGGASAVSRISFFDNLRSFIILLVILYHAGVVYESSGFGALYWVVHDPATDDLIGLVNITLDIFVMATLFFISGYLAPMSMEGRSMGRFLMGKVKRLMLPWVIAVLTLMPIYKFIFLGSRGMPQEAWTSYFHFNNGFMSQSWLWFLPVLFLFNVVYTLLAQIDWVPRKLPVRATILVLLIIGFVTSFAMEALGLQGWTKNALINFQNERLPLYFMTFLVGSLFYHREVFNSRPGGIAWYITVNCTAWIPIMGYVLLVILPFVAPGKYIISPTGDRVLLWFSFYLSFIALLYLVIETFRRYADGTGHLWRELNRNSYYVYIIHVIVMGAIGWSMIGLSIPALLKYAMLTIATWIACNLIISGWRAFTIPQIPVTTGLTSASGGAH